MVVLRKDLGPRPSDRTWRESIGLLQASDDYIAHIDTGLFPHDSIGCVGEAYPDNIKLDEGLNVFDAGGGAGGDRPVTDLSKDAGLVAEATQVPDHGVKTLSVILGATDDLRGVAPGAKVRPYRAANGPVFVGEAKTGALGDALGHALASARPPVAVSISMGNPGGSPIHLLNAFGVKSTPGMQKRAVDAVNLAYEMGVIVVCAGGQIHRTVAYPARFRRTIAVGGLTEPADRFTCVQYPDGGYGSNELIDVWAQAANLNRAAGVRDDATGEILRFHADSDDPRNTERKPVGTSYATPQVAAAAAMWAVRHRAALSAFDGERWKVVEAFRKALRDSADRANVIKQTHRQDRIPVRALNIEALLKTAPDLTAGYVRAARHSAHASWL